MHPMSFYGNVAHKREGGHTREKDQGVKRIQLSRTGKPGLIVSQVVYM